jgi:REP element-mobilizing transposase RayT
VLIFKKGHFPTFYESIKAGTTGMLTREICRAYDVEIIKGNISCDHVHIFVSVPPHISVSHWVQSVHQGEDIPQAADGIQVVEQGFLGTTYMGTRVLCGQFRQCDG